MSCTHLRQWLPGSAPGTSLRLPCADPDCPDGTGPIVRLETGGTTLIDGVDFVLKQRLTFSSLYVAERYNGAPGHWRWVWA